MIKLTKTQIFKDIKINILGSSSQGNCYLLNIDNYKILLDLGIEYKKVIDVLNFDFSNTLALITHEHKDHVRNLKQYLKTKIKVVMSKGTYEALIEKNELDTKTYLNLNIIKDKELYKWHEFKIKSIPMIHDAREPVGYIIKYKDYKILYITDTKEFNYKFKNIDLLFIESNYCMNVLLENNKDDLAYQQRVINTHLSNLKTKEIITNNITFKPEHLIVLTHISDRNNTITSIVETFKEIENINIGG